MAAARLQIVGSVLTADLPKVSIEDNGKTLLVIDGQWQTSTIPTDRTLSLAIDNLSLTVNKLSLAVDDKVPKSLSILPKIEDSQIETSGAREMVKVFVDSNGVSYYATLEQIKQLNTKTVFVNSLTDNKIKMLSNDDIILLEER